jgi:hypothetical protein
LTNKEGNGCSLNNASAVKVSNGKGTAMEVTKKLKNYYHSSKAQRICIKKTIRYKLTCSGWPDYKVREVN